MDEKLAEKTAPPVQSKGARTRERILDLAYDAVIRKGFAATSIEELVEAAGITKSGFFYHFKDKSELARQILERYQAENDALHGELVSRARELSADPLHSFLIFLKLYAETMQEALANHPGCLVATITFQDQSFDREIAAMNEGGLLAWRGVFLPWLEEIAERYPPRIPVDLTTLADNVFGVTVAAIILGKALRDPSAVSRQVLFYRDHIRLAFGDC